MEIDVACYRYETHNKQTYMPNTGMPVNDSFVVLWRFYGPGYVPGYVEVWEGPGSCLNKTGKPD